MAISFYKFVFLYFSALFMACSNGAVLPDVQGSGSSGNKKGYSSSGDQFGRGSLFGDGNGDFFDTGEEGEDFVYPVFTFTGSGSLSHREGSNTTKQTVVAKVQKTTFSFETTEYRAVGGKNVGEVNKQLQEKVYGQSGIADGNRASSQSLSERAASDPDFEFAKFFIFAADIKNTKKGEQYQFSVPIPVTVVPAAITRYKIFDEKPVISYSTSVSGSSSFQMTTSATVLEKTEDTIEIEITNEIIGDPNCTISGTFPLPRQVSYRIDTKKKVVTVMRTSGAYSDKNRCFGTSSLMNICKSDKAGDIEDYNGGCY